MQNNCVFCRAINKEQIIQEEENLFIILASHPVTRGHVLVISKVHYSKLVDVPQKLRLQLFEAAVDFGEKLKLRLASKAYTIKVNNELFKLEAGKGHVGHIHIHVIPRYSSNDKVADFPKADSLDELEKIKKQILKSPI